MAIRKSNRVILTCQACGIEYEVKPSKILTSKFCSRNCYWSIGKPLVSQEDRFWVKVRKTPGCWFWEGAFTRGYGRMWRGPGEHYTPAYAHQFSFYLHNPDTIIGNNFVLHSCDTPSCVNPLHLYLGSHKDNMEDKVSKGRQAKGETITSSKLVELQVLQIRKYYKTGKFTQSRLGMMFGVGQDVISRIVNLESWKHVQHTLE